MDSHAMDVYTKRSKTGVCAVVVIVLVQIQPCEDECQT